MKQPVNVVAFPLDRTTPSKNPAGPFGEPAVVIILPVVRIESVTSVAGRRAIRRGRRRREPVDG